MPRYLASFPEFVDAILRHSKDAGSFLIQSRIAAEISATGRTLLDFMIVPGPEARADAAVAGQIAGTSPMLEEPQIAVAVGAHLNRLGNKASCM